MTVSEMSIQNTTPSHQQRQHWLSEQALAWSGLPVVTIRPTMFLESLLQLAAPSVRSRDRIELPFGRGKTSPVAAADVAQVVAAVLADPVRTWPDLRTHRSAVAGLDGSPANSRTRCTERSRTPTSAPRSGNRG